MYCRRCQYDLPDGTEVCPVCSTPTPRGARKRNATLKWFIRFLDILTMLSGLIHALMWGSGSHFVHETTYGFLVDRQLQYDIHPGLLAVDILFAVLFLAIPIFSAMMRFQLMRERRIGRVFLVITLAVTLLWGLLYPLLICAVTGVLSSLMWVALVQSIVYAVLAAVPSVILLKSDKFIY